MSFATKPLRRKKPKTKPSTTTTPSISTEPTHTVPSPLLQTSWQIKSAYKRRAVPLVTTSGIHGTYTFQPREHLPQRDSPSPDPATSSTLNTHHTDDQDAHEAGATSDYPPLPPPSGYIRKRTQQSFNWTLRVIPELLPLYHRLLRTTQSLSRFQPMSLPSCSCGSQTRKTITVLCLSFDCESVYLPDHHNKLTSM